MANVTSLSIARAVRDNDNTHVSPAECLADAKDEIESGKRVCDKLLVLTLDTGEDGKGYGVGFYASKLSCSEMLALLEVAKCDVLASMGYIPN